MRNIYDAFHLVINGESSARYAPLILPGEANAPQPKYYEYDEVIGKDGRDRVFENVYNEYTDSYTFYFLEEEKGHWGNQWALLKQWLYGFNSDQLIVFQESTNLEWFKYLSKVEIESADRTVKSVGIAQVNFTFLPYEYAIGGLYHYSLSEVEYNSWYRCEPTYILTNDDKASKDVTISMSNDVGAYEVSFVLPGTCEAQVSVRDGIIRCYNYGELTGILSYSGDLKKLIMEHGVNDISLTDGIDVSVIPNWRRL
jgi:hypothetical protein